MSKPAPRGVPGTIDGYGAVRPFTGAFDNLGVVTTAPVRITSAAPGCSKVLPDIRTAIEARGLEDGGTISFHHHLRNGDHVLNSLLAHIADMGIRGVTVAASSLFPVHAPLVEHIERGTVGGLYTAYISGEPAT